MQDNKIMEEEAKIRTAGKQDGEASFKLSEAMVNSKHLNKCREDIKKVKTLMMDMQLYVQRHEVTLSTVMVDDDKLKISVELLEN